MRAVVLEVGLGAKHVGEFLLRPRRDILVGLELWNARLIRSRDVVVRNVLVGHGEPFGRHHRQRMPTPLIFYAFVQSTAVSPMRLARRDLNADGA